MRWLRSFPASPPAGRAYVQDDLPRLVNDQYDYSGLGELDDDVLLLEWDIAASREDRERFAQHASDRPGEVLVAPHTLYHVAPGISLAHRVLIGPNYGDERWITPWDMECDYFAFGMIYLPRDLIRGFLATPAPARGRSPYLPPDETRYPYTDCRFIDQTFSVWHRHSMARRTRIDWSVFPVHLHD